MRIDTIKRPRILSAFPLHQFAIQQIQLLQGFIAFNHPQRLQLAWFEDRSVDGFNVLAPHLPAGLEDFANHVVPELQRRGLFRSQYTCTTLRDHLGLSRPNNQFF